MPVFLISCSPQCPESALILALCPLTKCVASPYLGFLTAVLRMSGFLCQVLVCEAQGREFKLHAWILQSLGCVLWTQGVAGPACAVCLLPLGAFFSSRVHLLSWLFVFVNLMQIRVIREELQLRKGCLHQIAYVQVSRDFFLHYVWEGSVYLGELPALGYGPEWYQMHAE